MIRIKSLYFRILTIIIGIAAALVITEGVLRVADCLGLYRRMLYGNISINQGGKNFMNLKSDKDGLYWENSFASNENRATSGGLIDEKAQLYLNANLEKSLRIVILGDSVAAGFLAVSPGAPELKKNFSYLLQEKLKAALHKNVIAANLAVGSYGPYQEYMSFKLHGRKFYPNLVILCFTSNDLVGYVYSERHPYYTTRKGAYVINLQDEAVVQSLPINRGLNEFLTRHSLLFRLLNTSSDTLQQKLISMPGTKFYGSAKDTAFKSLDGILAICKKQNARFLIVMFPTADKPYAQMPLDTHPFEVVGEYCKTRSVECLNLIAPLRNYDNKEIGKDSFGHLTEKGHQAVADIIYDYLEKHPELLNSEVRFKSN